MAEKILIVVDMQKDFVNGSLGSKDAEAIVPAVVKKAKEFDGDLILSLIHISEPTRPEPISYAVFCLKKFFFNDTATTEIYTLEFVGSVRCV